MSSAVNRAKIAVPDGSLSNRLSVITTDSSGKEAVLTLDGRGMICDCNRAGEQLFKYRRSELVWRTISMLLPELAELELMEGDQPNARLRFLCRIGRRFEVVTKDGERFDSELCLNLLDNKGHGRLSLIVCPTQTNLDKQPCCRTAPSNTATEGAHHG